MGLRGVWVMLALVSSALSKNAERYSKPGGEVVLSPTPVLARITSVLWKHDEDQVAEWIDGKVPLEFNGILHGHASMSEKDGVLRIFQITKKHQGVYTVEINSDLQPDGFQVNVLNEVTKPEVVQRPLTCSQSSESCTLKCHGDTSGAEPVTYYWKRGEGPWVKETAEITITNKKDAPRPVTYTCRMENPVSANDSEPIKDPFSHEPDSNNVAVPVVTSLLVISLVVVVGGLVYCFRNKEPVHGWFVRSGIMKENEEGTSAESRGLALNGQPGSEVPKEGPAGSGDTDQPL